MKNAINYYYHLYPVNIYQNEKQYKFLIDDLEYYLVPYNFDLKQLSLAYEIYEYIWQYNIYCHQIIKNVMGELATNINNKNFVLLKIAKYDNQKINFDNIMYYQLTTSLLHLENLTNVKSWRELWIERVDYFEYLIANYKNKFPLIRKTASYYIGLAENGIQLLLNVKNNSDYCITHYRIKNNYTLFDFYNPLEFIVDSKTRDIAEYCKEHFFNNNLDINDVLKYIDKNLYNNIDCIMFFSRLLYPSYYFDLCDNIIYNNINENTLSNIIVKNEEYEKFLSHILNYLKTKFQIPDIEWLKKS